MRKAFLLAVVSTLWLMFAGSAAADSIYQVNVPVGVGSVMGTITTDGVIGTLDTLDIVSFSLTLSDGTGSDTLTSGVNGTVLISGGDVIATATQLLFNFNGDGSFMNFSSTTACSPPQWSLTTSLHQVRPLPATALRAT
jgi:hypothetical protein